MTIFDLYINTKKSIELNESYLKNLDKKIGLLTQKKDKVKGIAYDKEKVQSSLNNTPVDELYNELNRLVKERNIYCQMINADRELMHSMKEAINDKINPNKKETYYKVFVMHYIRGLSFQAIADNLDISLDHVYRCNGTIKKKLREAQREYEKLKKGIV